MRKGKFIVGYIAAIIIGIVFATPTYAVETTKIDLSTMSNAELTALVESLKAQIEVLKVQLALAGGLNSNSSPKVELKQELRRGLSGEEVRLLQRILATDSTLYPEGLTTGFFGQLTSNALTRLQSKFKLRMTGELNEETRELLNKILLAQGVDREIPPGLLTAPGLEGRIIIKIENNGGNIVYKIEVKSENDECKAEDNEEDEEEDSDDEDESDDDEGEDLDDEDVTDEDSDDEEESDDCDDENELEIEVKINSNNADVEVNQDGVETSFTLNETDENEIIELLATRLNLTESQIEEAIEFENDDNNEDED